MYGEWLTSKWIVNNRIDVKYFFSLLGKNPYAFCNIATNLLQTILFLENK